MVEPIALRAALLREQLPGIVLRPGAVVVARVLEQHAGKGALSLAGAVLAAELPESVSEGERLRLLVDESGPERIVLRLIGEPGQVSVPLPLPGSPRLHVEDEASREEAEENDRSISLVYETARLGALGLWLEVQAGVTRAVVRARPGAPHAHAEAAAATLEAALAQATGRPAQVRVEERRESLDVYA